MKKRGGGRERGGEISFPFLVKGRERGGRERERGGKSSLLPERERARERERSHSKRCHALDHALSDTTSL